jgi:hypothetical protein
MRFGPRLMHMHSGALAECCLLCIRDIWATPTPPELVSSAFFKTKKEDRFGFTDDSCVLILHRSYHLSRVYIMYLLCVHSARSKGLFGVFCDTVNSAAKQQRIYPFHSRPAPQPLGRVTAAERSGQPARLSRARTVHPFTRNRYMCGARRHELRENTISKCPVSNVLACCVGSRRDYTK